MTLPLRGPEPLAPGHDVSSFDCGSDALNRFLRRHALDNQRNQSSRTYVALRGETRVVGYYSLAAASAEFDAVPARLAKGLARHPIPLTLLARLAVDRDEQAAAFYRHFGFEPSPIDAFHLYLMTKDIQASLS